GVSVQPSSYTLAEGETLQLSASISPAEGTDPGENLLEAKDTTYPSIAADSYSGDVFILSSKYITSNKQAVMLFQNGVLLFSSSFRSAFDPYCIIE
ncbi:MAG: hypothetical protein IJG56_03685, partial [Clostridia bacterium]|nr:hypothetical protein [Clostridia bacterium]